MRKLRLAIAAALACSVLPALAQQVQGQIKAEPNGQTTVQTKSQTKIQDRIQDQPAAAEAQAALEKEIARLRSEVASLKAEIAALRESPPPVPPRTVPPAPDAGKDGSFQLKLPTAEGIARARAFIADAWHRLVEMLVNIQKDMMRKG